MAKQTVQNEAYYHNYKVRTEFRLDSDNQKDSSLRLLKVLSGSENLLNVYKRGTGVCSLIKSIALYSGNVQIDRCDNFQLMGACLNNLTQNRHSGSVNNGLLLNNNDFFNSLNIDGAENDVKVISELNLSQNIEGYIDLKPFLQFLKSTPNFNFPDCRLVIEWNRSADDVWIDANGETLNMPAPVLIYEEFVGESQPTFTGSQYLSWEHDRVVLEPINNGQQQSTKQRITGFDKKRVSRGLLAFTPNVAPHDDFGTYCSPAQFEETFQIYWNNVALLPDVVRNITKGRYFTDIFGDKVQPILTDQFAVPLATRGHLIQNDQDQLPLHSWGACDLQLLPITNLQIEYSRRGDNTYAWGTAQINLIMQAEVSKAVKFDAKGRPVVAYV